MRSGPIRCSQTPKERKLLRLLFGDAAEPVEVPHHVVLNRLPTQHDDVGGVSPLFWHLERKQDWGSTPPATACPPMIPLFRKR